MQITFNDDEYKTLMLQKPETASDGGYQNYLVSLQRRCDGNRRELELSANDLEKIPRYAFDYGQGGWEERLKAIFGRHLGPNLGRDV